MFAAGVAACACLDGNHDDAVHNGFSLLRRAHRILPAYYVHLIVLFALLVPLIRGLEFWRYNPTYLFQNLSAHIFLVHYFSPVTSASVSVNGALWTLSLEAQFYLLLPLIAPVFARAPWRTAAALLACAIAWRWAALHHMDGWVEALRAIDPRWKLACLTSAAVSIVAATAPSSTTSARPPPGCRR